MMSENRHLRVGFQHISLTLISAITAVTIAHATASGYSPVPE